RCAKLTRISYRFPIRTRTDTNGPRLPAPNPEEGAISTVLKPADKRNAHITLRLNGEEVEVAFAPYKTLLEVLREDLDLTGTKHGCELGESGACPVLFDGQPLLSCLKLAVECDGHAVDTIEGLAGAELHPLQAAFADDGGSQCGYCTPGVIMTAKA